MIISGFIEKINVHFIILMFSDKSKWLLITINLIWSIQYINFITNILIINCHSWNYYFSIIICSSYFILKLLSIHSNKSFSKPIKSLWVIAAKETQAKQETSPSSILWFLELKQWLQFYFHQIKKYFKIYFSLLAT